MVEEWVRRHYLQIGGDHFGDERIEAGHVVRAELLASVVRGSFAEEELHQAGLLPVDFH